MGHDIHNKLLNQFRFDLWRDPVFGFLPLTLVYKRGDILLLQTVGQCGRMRRRQTNHFGNLMVGQKAAVKHRKQNGSYLQDILPRNLQPPTPYPKAHRPSLAMALIIDLAVSAGMSRAWPMALRLTPSR